MGNIRYFLFVLISVVMLSGILLIFSLVATFLFPSLQPVLSLIGGILNMSTSAILTYGLVTFKPENKLKIITICLTVLNIWLGVEGFIDFKEG